MSTPPDHGWYAFDERWPEERTQPVWIANSLRIWPTTLFPHEIVRGRGTHANYTHWQPAQAPELPKTKQLQTDLDELAARAGAERAYPDDYGRPTVSHATRSDLYAGFLHGFRAALAWEREEVLGLLDQGQQTRHSDLLTIWALKWDTYRALTNRIDAKQPSDPPQ